MIVNRKDAEDASKEMLIHALFLSGQLTEQHVQEAYRSRARETHPDAPGGSAEEFVAVDRAKHVLLKWLERAPDGAPATLQPTRCPDCEGRGYIKRHRGFSGSLRVQCAKCRGHGDLDFEEDRGEA